MGHLKIIFNFIVTMLEVAMRSTRNASPTEPSQQEKVTQFEDEDWLKIFRHVEEDMVINSDDDMHGRRNHLAMIINHAFMCLAVA